MRLNGVKQAHFESVKEGFVKQTGAWFPASAFAAELKGERSAQKYPSAPPMRPANVQEGAASCTKPNYVRRQKRFRRQARHMLNRYTTAASACESGAALKHLTFRQHKRRRWLPPL